MVELNMRKKVPILGSQRKPTIQNRKEFQNRRMTNVPKQEQEHLK